MPLSSSGCVFTVQYGPIKTNAETVRGWRFKCLQSNMDQLKLSLSLLQVRDILGLQSNMDQLKRGVIYIDSLKGHGLQSNMDQLKLDGLSLFVAFFLQFTVQYGPIKTAFSGHFGGPADEFTVQYGPIKTISTSLCVPPSTRFTVQYGPIKTSRNDRSP